MELTITLDQLSDNELQIYNEAGYQQRFRKTIIPITPESWFFKEYYQIHNEYLKLHEQSNDSLIKLESLKRLIFLNWYFEVEPAYFTGIQSLDKSSMFNSYSALDYHTKKIYWTKNLYGCCLIIHHGSFSYSLIQRIN